LVTGILLLVGAVAMILGWWGVSGATARSDQYDWLNVGVAGVIVIGAANCGWLVAARRRLAAHAGAVYQRVDTQAVSPDPQGAVVPSTQAALVAATGMRHYHRADCEYARGKKVSAATLARHDRAGRRPCPVCRP
jgi:hypothetical protein